MTIPEKVKELPIFVIKIDLTRFLKKITTFAVGSGQGSTVEKSLTTKILRLCL